MHKSKARQDLDSNEQIPNEVNFPIVAVGASAGGLEAFSELLDHLSPTTGMAFVHIQHLDPQRESMLIQLLARHTKMPVLETVDGVKVAPNTVYVIPHNANLAILHGALHLMPRLEAPIQNLPIDYFLKSLAADHGSRSIGIILSGTASDGVLGLKAIKAEGGITFAQDEKSAKYDGMPHSAIAAGCVDFVLPPAAIAEELARIAKHPYVRIKKSALHTHAEEPSESNDYSKIFILLRRFSDVDFTYYKRSTIERRIKRRMMLHKIESRTNYVKYLEHANSEIEALYNDILINVTEYFRDPETFEGLRKVIFPQLVKQKPDNDSPLRIWVPGCSSGEEVYSIVIELLEYLHQHNASHIPIQLFATDIDDHAIEKARRGVYPLTIGEQVSRQRLDRFFIKIDQGYQVNKSIRDMCVFAKQNIFKDPPFSRVDLISCRNLLIYLGPVLQKRVLSIFHYALKPHGYLVLGTAETVGESTDLFRLVDQKYKFYSKKSITTNLRLEFTMPTFPDVTGQAYKSGELAPSNWAGVELQKIADKVVMERYAPPGVVINENLEILQFRGQTGAFFEPAPGEASLNLIKMARNGLGIDLRIIVTTAIKDKTTIRKENVRYKVNGTYHFVTIEVVPIQDSLTATHCYLVTFAQTEPPHKVKETAQTATQQQELGGEYEFELDIVKQELAATKEYLQSVIEQQETSNEELRSANEEIQSSNEELQSINEELETAKEELQSTNEELTTVNDELEIRNRELTHVNNDYNNLINSVNIAIVMVGRDLCIRQFSPLAEKLLNLIPTDIGRPITDIKPNIKIAQLQNLILESIKSVSVKSQEYADKSGHWYSVRIRPYQTIDNKIDGAVLSFIDVDSLKKSLVQAEDAQAYAEAIISAMRHPLLVLDKDLRVQSVSTAYLELFQVSAKDTIGNLLYHLGNGQWGIPALRTHLEQTLREGVAFNDFEVVHEFEQIGRLRVVVSGRQIPQGINRAALILMQIELVT